MQYEDDHFHPNNDSDDSICFQYMDDATYISSGTSVATNHNNANRKKQKQNYMKFKELDKGYRQLVREHNGDKVIVQLYITNQTPGVLIRDAVTGERYKGMKVGSFHEDAFFKVKDVSGELGRDSGNLYFETPKQCEKYLNTVINDKTKGQWKEKYDIYCKQLEKLETLKQ
jgi:hypothetical protein